MTFVLTDTNILLRSVDRSDEQRLVATYATDKLVRQGHLLCVTPQNLVECWAVLTRPVANNGLGMSIAEAIDTLSRIERAHLRLPEREDSVYLEWRRLVAFYSVSGKQTHDTRLVAAMIVRGVTHILTFNTADFKRFPEVTAIHPSDI